MRIMCVDNDKRALRKIMKDCAKIQGVTDVVGFTTEEEAMAWLRCHLCDIAFMETCKPGFNGLQLAASVKRLNPGLAVVFVTDEKRYGIDAFRLHATGYLMKPFSRESLREEIEYAMSVMKRGGRLALEN